MQYKVWEENQWCWQLSWRREWFQWEYKHVSALMKELKIDSLDANRVDEWSWPGESSNNYSVKSAYAILLKLMNVQPLYIHSFNFKYFWDLKALSSTHFFAWRVLIGKIATYDNLISRGIQTSGEMCVMCVIIPKSVNHLFFTCKVASKV